MGGLIYVIVYIVTLFGERKFVSRVLRHNMPLRSFDGFLTRNSNVRFFRTAVPTFSFDHSQRARHRRVIRGHR